MEAKKESNLELPDFNTAWHMTLPDDGGATSSTPGLPGDLDKLFGHAGNQAGKSDPSGTAPAEVQTLAEEAYQLSAAGLEGVATADRVKAMMGLVLKHKLQLELVQGGKMTRSQGMNLQEHVDTQSHHLKQLKALLKSKAKMEVVKRVLMATASSIKDSASLLDDVKVYADAN